MIILWACKGKRDESGVKYLTYTFYIVLIFRTCEYSIQNNFKIVRFLGTVIYCVAIISERVI